MHYGAMFLSVVLSLPQQNPPPLHQQLHHRAQNAADTSLTSFQTWRLTPWHLRRDILLRAASLLKSREETLKTAMREETSCSAPYADFQVLFAVQCIQETASRISALVGEVPNVGAPGSYGFIFREALGPILLIAPWNAALILAGRSLAAILGAGCTAIFKASELSPKTHHLLAQCFIDAGLPNGVLNVLQTSKEDAESVTEALIAHKAVKKVEFIGTYMHHGQICYGTERIIILRTIADSFLPLLTKEASTFNPGLPVSATISSSTHAKLLDAASKGATFLLGGPTYSENGISLAPTIVTGVTREMIMWDEETFGPCVAVFVVESGEEAVALVNESSYGFSTSIHTRDLERALEMSRGLEVGQVQVNANTVYGEANLPCGGIKNTGWGVMNSKWGLEEFTRLKTFTANMETHQNFASH
ncbi:hypothetical protein G7Y89_g7688 [Cudoniella acicularis]|uniref:Aldehyde dehydrogenase domain-containing protein n=1 Tax=Cudoniella acicularis TaxID=354080 RepID=A0A8H4RJL5_9HELO|nr:hypothetical protein G7Y89_g7688 [Cudoniella acicularis]